MKKFLRTVFLLVVIAGLFYFFSDSDTKRKVSKLYDGKLTNNTATAEKLTGLGSSSRYSSSFSTEEEAISYINQRAESKSYSFKVYFSASFGAKLFANNKYALDELLAKTRLKSPSNYSYSVSGSYIEFTNPSYYSEPGMKSGQATTINEFLKAFSAHTDALEEEFEILITDDLQQQLHEQNPASRSNHTLFASIYSNNGVMTLSTYTRGNFFGIRDIKYYPGKKILHAYRSGQTGLLDSREQKTLDNALSIVKGLSGDELQREKKVHDLLCDRITYYTDDIGHDDNDCAIGGLLNGKADCDGYADTFYLCGNLAGLNVRYQWGAAIKAADAANDLDANKSESDGSHMWNLICINNQWAMIDITWDDTDKGKTYVYYNIGEEQAKLEYIWDSRAIPSRLLSASSNQMRNPELKQSYVSNWGDLYSTLRSCSLSKAARIHLAFPPSLKIKTNHDRFSHELYSLGFDEYDWHFSESAMEVYNIRYESAYSICDSEKDIIEAVNQYAESRTKEFWLFFSPSFSPTMFNNDMRGIYSVLYRTRLKGPFSFSYNIDYRRILIQDAEYYLPQQIPPFTVVKTMSDVRSELRKYSQTREKQIILDYYGGDDLYTNSQEFANAIYASGIQSFSWSFFKSFVQIDEIVYVDHFEFCSTEAEVIAYLKQCKSSGYTSFQIYCTSESLYNSLHRNQSERFIALLSQSGCKAESFYSNSTWSFGANNARW